MEYFTDSLPPSSPHAIAGTLFLHTRLNALFSQYLFDRLGLDEENILKAI